MLVAVLAGQRRLHLTPSLPAVCRGCPGPGQEHRPARTGVGRLVRKVKHTYCYVSIATDKDKQQRQLVGLIRSSDAGKGFSQAGRRRARAGPGYSNNKVDNTGMLSKIVTNIQIAFSVL